MNWLRLSTEATLSRLKRGVAGLCGLVCLSLAVLFVQYYLAGFEAAELEARFKRQQSALVEVSQLVRQVSQVADRSVPTGLQASGQLQAWIERSAAANGCEVSEFRSASDVLPYSSRFSLETREKGWGQIDIHATLSGPFEGVLETLRSLRKQPIPFEMDALELSRSSVNAAGKATVSATVDLRALTRVGNSG